ncbi:MAG: hypothetical protein ACR2QW_15220 [bacterium]
MSIKHEYLISAVILAVSLCSFAARSSSDDFEFDYSTAEIGDFNGFWKGRVNCGNVLGFKPWAMVKISDGRGELGFGGGGNFTLGSLYADLNLQNGKIKWKGKLKPWATTKQKMSIKFKGYWMADNLKLKGRIGSYSCSGVITK